MTEYPSYLELHRSGELYRRAAEARQRLAACAMCPRACGVNRLRGEEGYCRAGASVRVASWNAHMWEEPPISGARGSGTIFFAYCTARCRFCQNWPISQLGHGTDVSSERLGGMMLELQRRGCHNINLVTPSHYVPQILAAVDAAAGRGLRIPILYNTNGYDAVDTLRLLEGVVDIYLPDAKYADDAVARRLSGFVDYTRHNRAALCEMKRQVGARLQLDAAGIATRGMVVRHLVLPHGLSQTPAVLQWLAENLGRDLYLSLMAQYFPAHRAVGDRELGRRITPAEYGEAVAALEALGFASGWTQEMEEE
ncbi:MAG TPA: radical SAM protein [Chloroflexi bacterium]|jgi:putative pyruvate formate lyase activating enzyme|nr:radical SAM protein [Chloroflexota bacterium]